MCRSERSLSLVSGDKMLLETSWICLTRKLVYRSPEFQFPVPLNDCVDTVRQASPRNSLDQDSVLMMNVQFLNMSSLPRVDTSRIILAGTSAGANLACGVYRILKPDLAGRVCGLVLNSKTKLLCYKCYRIDNAVKTKAPVTCDPRHFPHGEYPNESWTEHAHAPLLDVAAMEFCFGEGFLPCHTDSSC